jgi:hypothetical protein
VSPGSLVLGFPRSRRLTGTEQATDMNRLSLREFGWVVSAVLGFAAAGCSSDDDSAAKPPVTADIEIKGTWSNSDFGVTETDVIDDATWSTDFGMGATVDAIVEFSNDARYAIRKAPDDAAYYPSTFDKVVWTKPAGGSFYYCTAIYGCATADDTTPTSGSLGQGGSGGAGDGSNSSGQGGSGGAGDDTTPTCTPSVVDASDPANTGCGDFSWTKLSAP